jgi:hypothetical protein
MLVRLAIAEINKKTDVKISLESSKRSKHRRVTLTFEIKTGVRGVTEQLWNAFHNCSVGTASAFKFGHPNPSSGDFGRYEIRAPPSSMPLSVRFGTDSAMTPRCGPRI